MAKEKTVEEPEEEVYLVYTQNITINAAEGSHVKVIIKQAGSPPAPPPPPGGGK